MQAIKTKYLAPTNTKGARVTAAWYDKRVTLSSDHAVGNEENHARAVKALMENEELYGRYVPGHTDEGMVFVYDLGDTHFVERTK